MYESCDYAVRDGFALTIETGPAGIRRIEFSRIYNGRPPVNPVMRETMRQLRLYFAGELTQFDLPLEIVGTPFQQKVWQALCTISYGETRSYSGLAAMIGAPKAVRAVGAANGRNPIPIVIPCHRVIGSNGHLVGFGGGLAWKRLLLDLEAENAERKRQTAVG